MLPAYRVLDLTDDRGDLAGYLLAQLGADVVAVEPLEGQRSRRLGPFLKDREGDDSSVGHRAYNAGKRSVVVEGQAELEMLAADADVLIECGAFPVDLARLRELNPALITVSISAFGQTGPKAGWAATDLIIGAAAGVIALTGDADRAPIRVGVSQTWRFAATDAACAALLALWERHQSGRGQHADISAQQSYVCATQYQCMAALVGREPSQRIAGGLRIGGLTVRVVYPCSDGHVSVGFLTGPLFGAYAERMFAWIHEEGCCSKELAEAKWTAMGLLSDDPEVLRLVREGDEAIARFCATRSKAVLLQGSIDRRLLFAPIMTPRDLLALEHLAVREWWRETDGLRCAGPFVRAEASPLQAGGHAPRLGETALEELRAAGAERPSLPPVTATEDLPLAGLKVIDLTWVFAGPATTRVLADFGATVVHIESQHRPDTIRGATPHIGEPGNPENSLCWHSLNAGKLGFTLNLANPLSRDVFLDLVKWADVVVESFSPGAMDRLGIGYSTLRAVNPRIIMLSSSLMGQNGPMSKFAGFGMSAAAIAGFYSLAGWPDQGPSGPYGAYTDYPSPRFAVAALMGALERRRRTGEGQYLDFAQLEGAVQLIAPELLDASANNVEPELRGNQDPTMAPHGVYPVVGDDQWVAIACETDAHWAMLAKALGRDDLSGLGVDARLARRAELDEVIASWSGEREGEAVESELQALSVPAHRVQYAGDVVADPQLKHREHFTQVPHPLHGKTWAERSPIRLSRTPGSPKWAGPTFGEHMQQVLELLGYDDERTAELVAAGALE
ncbi:CoA transferase [Pseudohaliea sp.]|uniref:CaiB/BaiF CoA-transferase family protein n=1 Tax=Pseudohaliea sp. TaxID=2740289 RepID=UPI0032EB4BD7